MLQMLVSSIFGMSLQPIYQALPMDHYFGTVEHRWRR